MKIIIPMSGIGKRFINAGYNDPKPLIVIDGKPIIQHVVELFPGETDFTFICNQEHLDKTAMRDILESIAPTPSIIAIPPHKLGPVYAVSQTYDSISDDEEVIVNYCDFGTYWDYSDFLKHTRERQADGAIPAYRGFHPHMLGSTNYAFMRDNEQWMLEIKEKEPFTDNRMQEFASNGTYYFKHGRYLKQFFTELMEKKHALNGEYYVSLVYNLLVASGLKVSIYEIQHMLQWGTPQDVEQYNNWSNYFKQVIEPAKTFVPQKGSTVLIPMAGHGSRFAKQGYSEPKPLIDVSGKPMIVQAHDYLPAGEQSAFVCLKEHINRYSIDKTLKHFYPECQVTVLSDVTEGQAITCNEGVKALELDKPLLIAACDNGMLWNHEHYSALLADTSIDAIIWTFKNHPSSSQNPEMYGWVKTEGDLATAVSVKKAVSDHPERDHAIVGTFYFRQGHYFKAGLDSLIAHDIRVNNEFYVDSLMGELIKLGKKVAVFEVDAYIGWGTPNDYETFVYWQSFFHKSSNHPYRLERDFTVERNAIPRLENQFTAFTQSAR